jgi:hypothetical protein
MARILLFTATLAAGLLGGAMLHAQLLPPVGQVIGDAARFPGAVAGDVVAPVGEVVRSSTQLARDRITRLTQFASRNRAAIELDEAGEPAVRGEVLAVDPDQATMRAATEAGFTILRDERIEELDLRSVTLRPPQGWPLRKAIQRLRRIAPKGEFTPNHLLLPSGASMPLSTGAALAAGSGAGRPLGLIDGGVARHPSLGAVEQRGFVAGAPSPSSHGTAVASLIAGTDAPRGGAPGAPLLVADVYGHDPAGGNVVAISRALGWMAERGVPVVTISLVGPANALLARAVAASAGRGVQIVAAVGNDGPATPPAYPASYPQVISVTGVDGRNRPLIEAGRARHLDYAAPGADMAAARAEGGLMPVRGTSFAAPLVAGRLAAHRARGRAAAITALDTEARDLGRKGPDAAFGRGLICGNCRTPLPR